MITARSAGAAAVALAAAMGSSDAAAQTLVRNLVIAADPQPFGADDLLWMEVRVGDLQLAESMNVYASRAGVFVPLGEFSRVLELAVGVFPGQRRAEGWVLSPERRLFVDLATRQATLQGRVIPFTADQAAIYDGDLYVRADLLEQLLPVRIKADPSAQVLALTATEALPFQQRAERDQRRAGAVGGPQDDVVRLPTPYRLFTAPSFDVNVGGQLARDGVDQAGRYDIRAAGDLLHAGLEAYAGSDDDGRISDVRVTLSRKDPYGRALGALGGTRAALGDIFTPSMAIGAASYAGRGLYYSSAPLENLDLATPLNLRGELALGEDVELYVNEVLQRAQTSPVQGRYEFLDVPLAFGLNTLRLVFYGSQGQRREVVRRINFGTGQVEAGRFVLRLGAAEQGLTVFDVGGGEPPMMAEAGAARLVALADYGLSPGLTLSAGAARYRPQGQATRTLGSLGLRGSLGAVAAQVDAAFDDQGGRGVTLGVAARPFGVSIVGRHSEYAGGFIDETRQLGVSDQAPLARATDLRLDGQVSGPRGLAVPLSFNVRRLQRADDSLTTNAELRASAPIGRYYASSSVVYEAEKTALASRRRWLGASDVTTLISARLQARAGVSYELSPDLGVDTAYATVDWQISDANALRLGVVRTLAPQAATSLQASNLWRARRFDLALNVAYEAERRDWRIGLQMGFGFGYDPLQRRYELTRPGVAGGGAVAVNAWIDANGDGVRQPGEQGVGGLVADTPAGAEVTDDDGRVFATGLGDAAIARIRLNDEAIEDPFLIGGAGAIEIVPRAGRTVVIDRPMTRSAEVELTALFIHDDGASRPLAALDVELVSERDGRVIRGRSDHAGVLFFEGVPPGAYALRLQADQARTQGMSLVAPVILIVPADGGFVRGSEVRVRLRQGGQP
ncbi:hypothetical protein [Brevundimonas intermedia]|uniref:hypothetical protein n=1 Tax=Brevundimonas intermedia TaxID=74315 RepID=UPI00320A849C